MELARHESVFISVNLWPDGLRLSCIALANALRGRSSEGMIRSEMVGYRWWEHYLPQNSQNHTVHPSPQTDLGSVVTDSFGPGDRQRSGMEEVARSNGRA